MGPSWMRAVLVAFAFLTRLPLRVGDSRDADVGRSIIFFPLVGLALGMILTTAAWLVNGHVSVPVTAIGVSALLAAMTGGLHLDGVGDVFDGLSGGHGDRERTLTIMRDSRIGAHGVVAIVLLLLAKVFAVIAALQHDAWRALLIFPAVGRWSATPLIVLFPYAHREGLGRRFHDHASVADVAWATALTGALMVSCGARFLAPAVLACLVALALGVWLQRRLGGLTGDVYGAAIEVAEVVFLVAAVGGA